jgi:hypothetical protein
VMKNTDLKSLIDSHVLSLLEHENVSFLCHLSIYIYIYIFIYLFIYIFIYIYIGICVLLAPKQLNKLYQYFIFRSLLIVKSAPSDC